MVCAQGVEREIDQLRAEAFGHSIFYLPLLFQHCALKCLVIIRCLGAFCSAVFSYNLQMYFFPLFMVSLKKIRRLQKPTKNSFSKITILGKCFHFIYTLREHLVYC